MGKNFQYTQYRKFLTVALPGVFASFDENTTPRFPFYNHTFATQLSQRSNMDAKKKEHLALKDKLLIVTQENTKLLKEIASLKGRHMGLLEEIKDATSSNEKRASNDSRAMNAASEKAKLKEVASRQEREVELLKLEIQSLRTKRGNLIVYYYDTDEKAFRTLIFLPSSNTYT